MSWVVVEQEGKRHRVAVVRTPQGTWIGWPGGSALLEREREFAVEGFRPNGVRAPMTGRIVEVSVAPGDVVRARDLLVVMEAMKMEYRLTAPREATVEEVHCREGDLVDLGAPLVSLGP
jgi:biotin carboxyl carrier protein